MRDLSMRRRLRWSSVDAVLLMLVTSIAMITASSSTAAADPLYQTETIDFSDITTSGVYHVDHQIYFVTHGCTDYDTCTFNPPNFATRNSSGFFWFVPIFVQLGMSPDDHRYGLHGGLAIGGSGQLNQWYADWSGYPANGPALQDAATGHTFKPHTVTNLTENQWYRLRIWRVPCSTPDIGSEGGNGPLYGWLLSVKAMPNGVEQQAGTWCLRNAQMVSHAYSFTELNEPSVCTTDFWGSHQTSTLFDNGSVAWTPGNAYGNYADPTCLNTNLRSPTWNYVIDERMTLRTINGGLPYPGGWLYWQMGLRSSATDEVAASVRPIGPG